MTRPREEFCPTAGSQGSKVDRSQGIGHDHCIQQVTSRASCGNNSQDFRAKGLEASALGEQTWVKRRQGLQDVSELLHESRR